jgi:hypothetical protein
MEVFIAHPIGEGLTGKLYKSRKGDCNINEWHAFHCLLLPSVYALCDVRRDSGHELGIDARTVECRLLFCTESHSTSTSTVACAVSVCELGVK